SFGRFKTIIVAVARPVRRHDDSAIDAGLVHQRHQHLDGERLGYSWFQAENPQPDRRFRLPYMDLRVNDQAGARGWNGRRLSRRLIRNGRRQTGAERAVEKATT